MVSRVQRWLAAVMACAAGVAISGCGPVEDNTVTLQWWYDASSDSAAATYQQIADTYVTQNPTIKISLAPLDNPSAQMSIALQSEEYPDIYPSSGGDELAAQVQTGKVADLTQLAASWIGGLGTTANRWTINSLTYGVPTSLSAVGFWYNTDLFTQANIASPPTTMAELVADIGQLKASGVAAMAVGGKDLWPDTYYYSYFVLRECPADVVASSNSSGQFQDACFTKAGQDVIDLLALRPFSDGFNSVPAQEGDNSSAAMVASGRAAMELQGHGDLEVMKGLVSDQSFVSKIGWFPFPAIDGGAGDPTAILGDASGFSCTTTHPQECADFLHFLTSDEVQGLLLSSKLISLPVTASATSSLDPVMKTIVDSCAQAQSIQPAFDKVLSPAKGEAFSSAAAGFFAGAGGPSAVADGVNGA